MLGAKRAGKTLQERTNLPENSQKLLNGPTKKPWDDNDHHRLPQLMKNNPSVPHQQQRHPRSLASDANPALMDDKMNSMAPATQTDVSNMPQIKLLQAAINLLKTHAEDAGSNIEKLRVLLANRDTEPATYRSLQRQRFFEERRELDAHRALWSTTQKVTAIVNNDASTFEHQQLSDQSLGLFHYAGKGPNPEHSSRIREHSRLIPLTLASKADYRLPKRASKPPPLANASSDLENPSSSCPSSYTPPLHRMPSGKSGTAAIFHHTAKPDRERLAQQIKDVEVTMPDYVGDLLSEFDSASNPPLLPLTSPQTSPQKRMIDLPPSSLSPTKAKPLQLLDGIVEETNSGGVKTRTSEHQPRVLKRKGSQKRFSNLFSSKKSHGSAPPSSFPADLVSPLQESGSSALTSPAPLSSAATSYSSPSSPLRSSFSMSALQAEDVPPVVSPSLKRFSANSVISLVSSSAHDHHQQAPPEEKEKDGVTSRIKKRISKLRG